MGRGLGEVKAVWMICPPALVLGLGNKSHSHFQWHLRAYIIYTSHIQTGFVGAYIMISKYQTKETHHRPLERKLDSSRSR
jgi:hypothetical protein